MKKRQTRIFLTKPWLFPDKALVYLLQKLPFRLRTDSFGWLQAILYSWRIDIWQRYSAVAQEIKRLDEQCSTILDVGGERTTADFLHPDSYSLCILNLRIGALRLLHRSRQEAIAGDGCYLPFKDDSFDVVISVDCLEHVPALKKADFCAELKRVARNYVLVHCPADSDDKNFQATIYDTKFLEWYRRRFRKDEPNSAEHLKSGLPKVENLTKLFPGCTIIEKQNCRNWLKYMTLEYTPYARLFAGLIYKTILLRREHMPPHHACLLVWRKS